ncbi:hypothetical protein DF046_37445 [Burkholderia cepacia]|uniref:hypothetical protein n=1 Tax=Burkholderia cepacia TaxID=292 RepID=UPI000F5B5108|nr:hypothetical protein [Burkholderia cepacia]RQT42812.1 hypothetical protein DF046_37445 [Burkholderia cepacia]
MAVSEAARFLFVSRPHVRKLIERGALTEVLPKRPEEEANIDPQSVLAYRIKQDIVFHEWLDSHTGN